MDETKKPVNNPAGAESELNAGLGKDLSKMRDASYLLPSPIGEVVRELLDEIERLRRASEPVAWRHETTCEFISDEMKREFPDTLFIRKCNIPLFGEPVIRTTEAINCNSDIILRKQIDAQNVALQEASEEYAMLKAQFDALNKLYLEVSELRKALDPVTKALLHGLITDGAHHKQWALEQAFRALCMDDYVDQAKAEFQWEDGIAP